MLLPDRYEVVVRLRTRCRCMTEDERPKWNHWSPVTLAGKRREGRRRGVTKYLDSKTSKEFWHLCKGHL